MFVLTFTGMRGFPAVLAVVCSLALASACSSTESDDQAGNSVLRVVATGLADPYEIVWGPDGFIWATEKTGKRVTRIDPANGRKITALTIEDAVHTAGGQDGVLGLALHPDLLKGDGHDYVYVSHTYDAATELEEQDYRTKIVRYTYDKDKQVLGSPVDLITGLAGGVDHQSGKLRFGPDAKLYYTIGDQGANQFALYCESIEAQTLPSAVQVKEEDWSAYRGKILRLNLDGSIPDDNPEFNGVRSHLYAMGFRNAQGLAFAPSGLLYGTDQGPKTDDEVNLIRPGKNYGWPNVAGYQDDKAYVYAEWAKARNGCRAETYSDYDIPLSVPQTKESDWDDPDFAPPLVTFETVENDFNFRAASDCLDPGTEFICWPTLALSSLEVHPAGFLLATSLKDGSLHRIPLTAEGKKTGTPSRVADTTDRYRDTALDPTGKTVFIATDRAGYTRDADGSPTLNLQHPGSILAYDLALGALASPTGVASTTAVRVGPSGASSRIRARSSPAVSSWLTMAIGMPRAAARATNR
ncbi:hypothetical protein Acor_08010 [Acrocarpospora corrugata]|uniref:Glucose/Sorbosone dehydrogenase domain-containing protein n=1 Tax=Acrocarpospora corrugata TaxID=35763 RepID=A0A5M3VRC7_9ACTN|nr:hypothetical protein Acor_08010 [Acrocarpospora corrugata]